MRAMRRARMSSAALRAAASSRSQGIGTRLGGSGSTGGSGGSRKTRFSCTVALLLRRRLDRSAVESVDEMAQPEQIAETAERARARVVAPQRPCAVGMTSVPVGPRGRNERAAAVRQADKQEKNAAAPDAADHRERAALEGVALAGDRHRIWAITAMGSLPPLPSGAFRTPTS